MIHLTVIVTNPAELLDAEAYDAGALLRWESSATIDGTYVEGGTVALVAGTFLYDVWDDPGTTTTWYRTRVSNAGGTVFSPYSAPFQPASAQLYLSLDQFRAFEPASTLSDESLLILLQASAADIVNAIGPTGDIVERLSARGPALMLSSRAAGIVSVSENPYGTPLALVADDYELSWTGRVLRRLMDGTNPSSYWRSPVRVTYSPPDDLAQRQRAQLELVRLSIAFNPGLVSQTIGTWSETYRTDVPEPEQRAQILASLSPTEAEIR